MSPTLPIYDLPDAKLISCLFPPEQEALARAQGPLVQLNIAGQRRLLPQSFFNRADSYGVEKLHQAGIDFLAGVGASAALGARSYDKAWEAAFEANLNLLHDTWRGRQRLDHQASVNRRLEIALGDEAQGIVGRVLAKTQSAGLRSFFDTTSADRASLVGKLDALFEIRDKAEVPTLRQALLQAGVAEADLQRIATLTSEINRGRLDQARQDAAAAKNSGRLRALKALVLAEISKVSAVAKADLPDGEWEQLQVGRLLDLPARPASGRVEPQPTTPPPAPTTRPPAVPPPIPADAMPATTPSTAPAAPQAGTAIHTAPLLIPGTVLRVTAPGGGPPLSALVQADGTLTLLTAPSTVAAAVPAAAPRRKGRGQSRGRATKKT